MQTINHTMPGTIGAVAVAELRAAMIATIGAVAADAGLDPVLAAREPVSLGAAFDDLCRLLGIAPPAVVLDALS